jgi:hypothetical protein
MDLGGLLLVLGGYGLTFIEDAVKGVGEQAGKAAWRAAVKAVKTLPEAVQRVLHAISERHRMPVQIRGAGGAAWTIGDKFRAAPLLQRPSSQPLRLPAEAKGEAEAGIEPAPCRYSGASTRRARVRCCRSTGRPGRRRSNPSGSKEPPSQSPER